MVVKFCSNGDILEIDPDKGNKLSLELMQKHVDGYIEMVFLPKNKIMICNEEGMIKQLPINERATMLHAAIGGVTPIHGDVLVVDSFHID